MERLRLAWVGLALPLAAQVAFAQTSAQDVVVPALYLDREAGSHGSLAGFEARARQQILVRGDLLAAAAGTSLTALSVRRDASFANAYSSATTHLRVTVAPAARPTTAPSPTFADNLGAPAVVVFDQDVALPASPPPPVPVPWVAPYVVRLSFATPFAYAGGDLCLELEGEPINAPPGFLWWVDTAQEAPMGTVAAVGTACGEATAQYVTTAHAWGRNLTPGGTFALQAFGRANTPAVLLLGALLATPVALDPLGATGCKLYVQPAVQLVSLYASGGTLAFTPAVQRLTLPAQAALLSARFAAQWVDLEGGPHSNPAGLTTSNALDLQVAATVPAGSLSTVVSDAVAPSAALPLRGRVDIARGPVLRLEFR